MNNFPIMTSNKNVPGQTFLICEYSQCSGEIITTIYIDVMGQVWRVTDWANDKPHKVDPMDIAREMGMNTLELYRAAIRYFDSGHIYNNHHSEQKASANVRTH